MDRISVEERSRLMSRVGGKNTKPELAVRRLLHRLGFRFRLHISTLPGKPDVVLPKYRSIIFVHGCFWHGHHGCRRAQRPSSNAEFWNAKLEANKLRDQENLQKLKTLGWKSLTIWQCEIKDIGILESNLLDFLQIEEKDDFQKRSA